MDVLELGREEYSGRQAGVLAREGYLHGDAGLVEVRVLRAARHPDDPEVLSQQVLVLAVGQQ